MNKKNVIKKVLTFALTVLMMLGSFSAVVLGETTIDSVDTAIYLRDSFYGNSGIVDGDIYSSAGDVGFNNTTSNAISGNIYLNSDKQFVLPDNYNPDFSERVIKLDNTPFTAPEIAFLATPQISNFVQSFATGWGSEEIKVTEDTHFGSLQINKDLKVDVSEGDIYIIVDSLVLTYSDWKIELVGDGTLYLFFKNGLSLRGSQTITAGAGGKTKTHLFVNGDVTLENAGSGGLMYSNIYVTGGNISIKTTNLYGNVVSNNSASFAMPGNNSTIFGTVYVPSAFAQIGGSARINGRLVADSLDLTLGNGKITYDEGYAALAVPGNEPAEEEPAEDESEEDEEENDAPSVIPTEMDIPDGESLLINFPYAYLYGNDDGTVTAENPIKREEASALIYRLLKQDNKLNGFSSGAVEPFENIESDRWSKTALEFTKYIGVSKTSYISAEEHISRGEVAKIVTFALRIKPDDSKAVGYSDLPVDNQYYHYIKALSDLGVLIGHDNKIEPDKSMTRAEFVTMVNRMIGRGENHELADPSLAYSDLSSGKWFYEDVMRASFGYFETKEDGVYKINLEGKPDRASIDYN